jgi:hypothetical protein
VSCGSLLGGAYVALLVVLIFAAEMKAGGGD